jgi:serine/threonine-protein kinase
MAGAGIVTHARFGKYVPITRLATGGMAEVYLARLDGAAGFQKHVALKLILPELAEDERFITMFRDEARIAAQLSHPNICQIYELGEHDGQYFIAMEYLDGVPLGTLMKQLPPAFSAGDARMLVGLILQACEGLHHAHELVRPDGRRVELVHRDVSPPNLFVTAGGALKVLDFGIARARDVSARTRSGQVKGKYPYMAPEQLRGEELDRRVDVFAIGVVAFEMLAGQRLFRRETDYLVFQAITEEPIPTLASVRPDAPAGLCTAVDRALARDREQRWPTTRAFGEALLAELPSLGGAPSPAALAEWVQARVGDQLERRRATIQSALALADAEPLDPTNPESPVARARRTPAPRRRTRWAIALAGGVLLAGAGALIALRPARAPDSAPPPVAVAPQPAPPPAPAPAEPARTEPPPHAAPGRPASRASAAPGFFTVDSTPYASIYVDGVSLGDTPIFRARLSPGRHQVRAVSRGRTQSFSISIDPGREAPPRRITW